MRDYFLNIFLNYFLFVVIGMLFHSLIAEEFYNGTFILLLIGGIWYAPIYFISSCSLFFQKSIPNPLLRIILLPLNTSGLLIAILYLIFEIWETALLFFIPAQLLASSIIFGISKLTTAK